MESVKTINEKTSKAAKIEDAFEGVETYLKENPMEIDKKYFVLVHGVFDKNIYAQFSNKAKIIKFVSFY